MTQLDLSIALERYDRHVPFFMGSVPAPDGLVLRPYEVGMAPPRRDGINRHRRFLEDIAPRMHYLCVLQIQNYVKIHENGDWSFHLCCVLQPRQRCLGLL